MSVSRMTGRSGVPCRHTRTLRRRAGPAKGAGFADALIAFKALRTALDAGEALTGVYTFDAAMQRLPHTVPA